MVETEFGTYNAVVFEALPGKLLELEELQMDQFFIWGSALGRLHSILKDIPEKYRAKRPSWKEQLISIQAQLPLNETAAYQEFEYILNRIEVLNQNRENYGLIHYDFELDNQRWEGDVIGILDFNDCVNHWFIADIAFALRDLFENNVDLQNPSFQEFLKGYQSETELDTSFYLNSRYFSDCITLSRLQISWILPIFQTHKTIRNGWPIKEQRLGKN